MPTDDRGNEHETAETTDLAKELNAIDVELPEPDDLDDVALHKALWCIIEGLPDYACFWIRPII